MLGETCTLFIVGNKLDLESKRNVPKEEAEGFAASVQALFAEASAKENIGIERIFDELTKSKLKAIKSPHPSTLAMIKNNAELMESKLQRQPSLRRQGSRRQIRIADEAPQPQGRKCC
jgi:GTPase SAR1 family protein